MSQGIIYYNYGTGCLVRMVVSLHTLRKQYSGDVTIISDGDDSGEMMKYFLADPVLGVEVVEPKVNVKGNRNHHYLAKCRLHELSPYDLSLFVDADTIVTGNLTPLFPLAEKHEFVVPQFSNWSSRGKIVNRRIREWRNICPRDMEPATTFGPAVNTGVMAFTKGSAFMKDWFKVARRGRDFFIPDETSCQVILHRYPHLVTDWFFNASCKYDDVYDPRVKLIHYHGRKHCREGLPFNGDLWMKTYEEVLDLNVAGIRDWTPAGDRQLIRHLRRTKRKK